MIRLARVSKRYDHTVALHETDLEIEAGRTVVLLGPSGCGKSTLLRLMTGLIWPDSGAVHFADTQLTPANILQLRRRMGYLIQDGGLFPHLTARANATLMARYLGTSRAEVEGRVVQLAAMVRLDPAVLSQYPGELSGGQKQRVALMRALMLDPDVLLLDEPLGALDPMIRFELQNELKELFAQLRKTVVMVTHDLAEAAFFADRIVLLREGRIVQQGRVDDLVKRPAEAFVERFIRAQQRPLFADGGAA